MDDLSVLELVMLSGLVTEYNFKQHVASDIGIDELYVPASSLRTQDNLNTIADWTQTNRMKLNEEKQITWCSRAPKQNLPHAYL